MSRSVTECSAKGDTVGAGRFTRLTSARPDIRPVRLAGIAVLAAVAAETQMDAIVHSYLAWLPLSFFEISLAVLVGLAVVLLILSDADTLAPAGDATAIRLIVLLCLWMMVCFAFSEFHKDGLDYMIRAWAVMLLPVLMPLFVRKPSDMWPILIAICAAGLLNGSIMAYETFSGSRLFSTSYAAIEADFDGVIRSAGGSDLNPTTVSQMVMVSAVLALGLGARMRVGPISALWLAVFVCGAVGVVLVSARSSIIALGLGGFVVLMSFYRHRLFPLFVLGAMLVLAMTIPFVPESVFGRFAAIADFAVDRSLFRRVTYLRVGFDLLEQSPLWGVGPGNFPSHYVEDVYRFLPGRTLEPRELHNTYLDVATEYGLIGLGLFAAIFASAAVGVVRAAHVARDKTLHILAFAVAVALVCLLLASFFMPHKDMRYLWMLAGMALMCGTFARREGAGK